MAQLCGAAESGGGAVSQLCVCGFYGGQAETWRTERLFDPSGLDRRVLDGRVVVDGVEVSAVREDIRQPVVDAALHQLRAEQGRSGGKGADEELGQRRKISRPF